MPTPDVHVSPAEFEERVIVSDVRRHPAALVDSTKSYVEATSSIVRFLIAENEHMAKELQVAKKGGEQATASTIAELRREIMDEVSSLETFM